MNCRTIQEQLMRATDRETASIQPSAIDAHVRTCASCQQFVASLETASAAIQADADAATVPTADAMWASVRSRLNETGKAEKQPRKVAPIIWIAAPLAAAAALAFAIFPGKPLAPQQVAAASVPQSSQVNYVETTDPNATTMVYVDKQSGWLVVWADDPSANRG